MTFSLDLTYLGPNTVGWLTASIACDDDDAAVVLPHASYLNDALRHLVVAVAALLTDGRAVCAWADEPGTIWWKMWRIGATAHVEVVKLDDDDISQRDYRAETHDTSGLLVFYGTCDALEFGRRVHEAAESLRSTYSESFEKPFPAHDVGRLASAVHEFSRSRNDAR